MEAIDCSYQTLTLAASLLVAGYLSYRSWTPPNPPPVTPYHQDRAGKWVARSSINARRTYALVSWLYYTALTLTYPKSPALLCPFPQNMAPSLFTWSPYTIVGLCLVFLGAPIRLLAFAQLGKNFTFQLAKPKTLVKTGMYAYVQHPSYTGNLLVGLANLALLARPSGFLGCWLPSAVVIWGERGYLAFFIVMSAVATWGISVRVRDEEGMLRKEFGKEWEDYHAETKRYVPWLY